MSDTNVSFVDFLTFDRMVTPLLIKVIYYIGVAFWLLGGLLVFFIAISLPFGGGWLAFGSLVSMVMGPLFARIGCEFTIVIFNIHTRLRSIDATLKQEEKMPGTSIQGQGSGGISLIDSE